MPMTTALLGFVTASLLAVPARAGEVDIPTSSLPVAVSAAVAARYPDGVATSASQEPEGQGLRYEVRLKVGPRRLDVAFRDDGTFEEEEETVAVDALPASILALLQQRYAGWVAKRAERSTTAKGTSYELLISQGSASKEVVLRDERAEE
jgi:hypothetical protein